SRARSQLEQQLAEQRRAAEDFLQEQTKLHAAEEQRLTKLQQQWDESRNSYDEERAQYVKRLEAGGRAAFLAEVGRLLCDSLDESAIQQRLLALAVPTLSDGCVLHEHLKDGSLRRVAQRSPDDPCPTPLWSLAPQELQSVLTDGKARLFDPVPDNWLPHLAAAQDPAV